MRIYRLLMVFFVIAIPGIISAQVLNISSIVRDVNTYSEISGVNIFIKNTQFGTMTNLSGKFLLRISGVSGRNKVVFQHVGYEVMEISLDSLSSLKTVYLQPRIIPLQGIRVEEEVKPRYEISKDIPQPISIIEAKNFEIRGFVDAGDLLRTDNSIQVEEELSGKKTVAIRGGNPDEVIVMYNGIKMNNTYDNVFDFSLIDLEDVQRIEIIRGSNTALYGPEAFSGVINIVPKLKQDYSIRFNQRIGTYRSGNWGLHLYQDLGRLQGNISYKKGAYKRSFVDSENSDGSLINTTNHYNANLNYDLSEQKADGTTNSIGVMWLHSTIEYNNFRDSEKLGDENDLYSLKYHGDLFFLHNLELTASYRELSEIQSFSVLEDEFGRDIQDQTIFFKAEKRQRLGLIDLLVAYEYQDKKLNLLDNQSNIFHDLELDESSELTRRHHGLVSILKFNIGSESEFFKATNMDISVRYDRVNDEQSEPIVDENTDVINKNRQITFFGQNAWSKTTVKFSVNLSGYREDLTLNSYINFGKNIKFPTLFQQISIPDPTSTGINSPNLQPEKNASIEIGGTVTKELPSSYKIYGWQISGNYFQNIYDNKFRSFTSPNVPIAFYDNVPNARISGVEAKSSVFLFKKKITIEAGLSKYSISEKAAFPFKSDFKRVMNFNFDHWGWSLQLHWFKENEQSGWLRFPGGGFAIVTLPDYSNIDVHFSKKFRLFGFKYFMNFSGRNLLDDDEVLQGLAIRDRRFYLTVGLQY